MKIEIMCTHQVYAIVELDEEHEVALGSKQLIAVLPDLVEGNGKQSAQKKRNWRTIK